MDDSLYLLLSRREGGEYSSHVGIRTLYGSKEWIDDLDIVNELGGHTGCVNALCWSRSGRLLASGSDDVHVNIYSYQPESSTALFSLNTSLFTGHKANIFSVKFMPHSNDRTLVSCAGDSQVRVFDIEYSSNHANVAATSDFRASARSQRFNSFFSGTQYLSEASTHTRVYRSHSDRVKRIVTESSPYLFLTCSEDGEVRQWDLRQPSEKYPPPRGGQGFLAYRPGIQHDDTNVPPPLISYKRFHLDLNTISCSSSQPHYIALGGAHLHCFLHDRRMLGRDIEAEKGDPGGSSSIPGSHEDVLMGRATRCVRRFAPGGKRHMNGHRDGHITACKISDSNPNEMVVSWSGDHIYSFDLVQSPDIRDVRPDSQATLQSAHGSQKRRSSKSRKRKRAIGASMSSNGSNHSQRARRFTTEHEDSNDVSFRVTYANGGVEEIRIPSLQDDFAASPENTMARARNSVLSESQRLSARIAKGLVKLRKSLFSLEATVRQGSQSSGLTPYSASFSSALTEASTCLPRMTEVMRNWRYPMNPTETTVRVQQTLRRNRESTWRFIQAAGTISRVLGGSIQGSENDSENISDATEMFQQIDPAPSENDVIDQKSQFGYDFLKAILLWLEGGRPALLNGFKSEYALRRYGRRLKRFPITEAGMAAGGDNAIDATLIPYLQDIAGDSPVVNVDASRFEHDNTRFLFVNQHDAVDTFAKAIKLPLEDLEITASRTDTGAGSGSTSKLRALDRSASIRYWALKVGRGILMETGSDVNFEFVNRAFGGLLTVVLEDSDNEQHPERVQEDTDLMVEEEQVSAMNVVVPSGSGVPKRHSSPPGASVQTTGIRIRDSDPQSETQPISGSAENELHLAGEPSETDPVVRYYEDGEEADSDEDDEEDSSADIEENGNMDDADSSPFEGEEDNDEDTEDPEAEELFLRRLGIHGTRREDVALDVPCSSHTRVYSGHCNIKTVKDVNFFGLNDEYVVSGCDSGHLFIWDRKTAKLVNILEGDSEVVNVVQGHPYEPTIAASGIDNTVKIFSPDRRAQDDARMGINILNPDNPANTAARNLVLSGGLQSRKRMHRSYQIMSQNDVDRQGGMSEAYITRSMLARLAASLRDRNPDRAVVLEENCNMM